MAAGQGVLFEFKLFNVDVDFVLPLGYIVLAVLLSRCFDFF